MSKLKKLYLLLLISSLLNAYASSDVTTITSNNPENARFAFGKAIEMIQTFAIDESGNMRHPQEVVTECKNASKLWDNLGVWAIKVTPCFPVNPKELDMDSLEDKFKFFSIDYIYNYDCKTICIRYLSFIRDNITGELQIKENSNGLGDGNRLAIFCSKNNGEQLKEQWSQCKIQANQIADGLLPK